MNLDQLLETGLVPDPLIRIGIRYLLWKTLREKRADSAVERQERVMRHIEGLRLSGIAEQTAAANVQHYEVPTRFYQYALGRRLKYSSGLWEDGDSLDQSEERMLALSCERAELANGQRILELGCGWGSLSLWMAEKYPEARITGVSNSRTQKEHIDSEAARRGLRNLEIVTADMNQFEPQSGYDRVVSVEMFEHMKNYELLMAKVARSLVSGGKLFVHIFTHRDISYHYEDQGEKDWITRYFFAGGQMPSDHLLLHFQEALRIEKHWVVNGTHYARTSEAWLKNMDAHRAEIWPLFEETYGVGAARRWWSYWRIFFMSCAELWGYAGGEQWFVSHYRFRKP